MTFPLTLPSLALLLLSGVCASASPAQVVRSVTDPQMQAVLASVREPALAACKLTGAGTARSTVTLQNFEDIAVIDASVLETPLDSAEQTIARDTLVSQYLQNTPAFMQGLEVERKLAQVLLHGTPTEQMQARTLAWLGWLAAAPTRPPAARWLATVKRHNSPICASGNLVVTNRQLDALFVSNDWVARAANLPVSTPETRAAFARTLPGKFPSMTQLERQQLAIADLRWDALRGVLGFGLQAKAIQIVQQNVHRPDDIAFGARHLEDAAIQFDIGMAKLNKQVASTAIAITGGTADGAVAQSIGRAQDRFEGKFDVPHRH